MLRRLNMFIKIKKKRRNKKIVLYFIYIIFLILLGVGIFLINFYKKPILLSPLGNSQKFDISAVEKKLHQHKVAYSKIEMTHDAFLQITLRSGGTVLLDKKKDIDSQISSLQRLISSLTIKGRNYKKIDFRFEKIVVEYE